MHLAPSTARRRRGKAQQRKASRRTNARRDERGVCCHCTNQLLETAVRCLRSSVRTLAFDCILNAYRRRSVFTHCRWSVALDWQRHRRRVGRVRPSAARRERTGGRTVATGTEACEQGQRNERACVHRCCSWEKERGRLDACRASRVIRAQSPCRMASAGVSHDPPTTATFESARYWGAVSKVIPPVGQKSMSAKGLASALSMATPPTTDAGNSLTNVNPISLARITSLGVATPGSNGSALDTHASTTASVSPGLTAKRAPAAHAERASAAERIVPAPTMASGTAFAIASIHASAADVRSVTSSTRTPPSHSARASGTASCTRSSMITGTTGPAAANSIVFIPMEVSRLGPAHEPPQRNALCAMAWIGTQFGARALRPQTSAQRLGCLPRCRELISATLHRESPCALHRCSPSFALGPFSHPHRSSNARAPIAVREPFKPP